MRPFYTHFHNVSLFLQMFVQLVEKNERVFNASSTLTPDSMMSDESQSRDWILPETASGCTAGASKTTDVPQKTQSESDVRQFSNISSEGVESCVLDSSTNKCECSDVTESSQMHNRCMLSGIDVSSINSDANISLDSTDISAVAELNDARLSLADGDSSLNSTLKGSDEDKLSSKCSDVETNALQPTFSVSIPISTMFEIEKNKEKIADVPDTDVKSPIGVCGSKSVMQAYSPISDADEETPVCQSPVDLPSSPSANKRSTTIAFSPISPFTPRPSAPDTPLSGMPLYWSCSVSSSSACDTSVWDTSAVVAQTADIGETGQHHSDKFMSAAATAVSPSRYFTFTPSSSYCHQSSLGHGNVVRPTQVNAPAGYCWNASFEQQQQTRILPHHVYQHPENRYPSTVLPEQHGLSRPQQTYVQCTNTVGMSTHPLYSARSQKQDATQLSSVEAGKCSASLPSTVMLDSKTKSHCFTVLPHREVQEVVHLPPITNHAGVSNCDNLGSLQTHHNAAANASFSSSSNGEFMYFLFVVHKII